VEGSFQENKKEGKCTCIVPGANEYTGIVVNDRPNGPGVNTFSDGSCYTGEFGNGIRNG